MAVETVVILADDLIWATRLADLVRGSGREPAHVRSLLEFGAALQPGCATIIDLTARAYEGIPAVEMAAHLDARILCVGQHDDHDLRRRALDAGAERVLPYRALFERGPALLARWLAADGSGPADDGADQSTLPGGDA
jgi:hypothetical protein